MVENSDIKLRKNPVGLNIFTLKNHVLKIEKIFMKGIFWNNKTSARGLKRICLDIKTY